ncbi:MAG: response regulator [Flavobacteriales bacterium]|nr:response regulator [Flavobacteriales bacterium]
MNMTEQRIRVLFVDDEEGNLKAFRSTFRREMDVLLAHSGEEALRLLETQEVHVVISDQRMPAMSGSQFLAIVKERHPQAMRMLLTGYSDLEAVIAAVNEGGIHAYATKPWIERDLLLRIEQVFEVHQLKATQGKLLQQYRQVFTTSGDPIVIVDQRGRVLEANDACTKLMEAPVEELIGSRFTQHLENARGLVATLRDHHDRKEMANLDLTIRTRKGNLVDCLMTTSYLGKQPDGRDLFQAIIKDITDRKQEEKRLVKLNSDLDKRVALRTAQLLEALEDLGSFSYTVAHDLRSPLKNIAALSEHLRNQVNAELDREECTDISGRIHKGAQRMIELVDDLLRFSQTNTRQMERTTVPLRPLVNDLLEELVPEDRIGQVRLEMASDATVLADAPMLKVVLQNLLSNALKFTRTIDAPTIIIGHVHEGERDLLYIKDNGVGFESKHRDQVFGAFKRLHNTDQFEGTGVGLAIVHRIVSKHGGEVWAESAVGVGTTIRISLAGTAQDTMHGPFGKVA